MRKTEFKKILSLILCIVLIAVTALFAAGCSDKTEPEAPAASDTAEATVLGEGATAFDLTVVDGEGNESAFTVNTDEMCAAVKDIFEDTRAVAETSGALSRVSVTISSA